MTASSPGDPAPTVHATAVVIGRDGVLIRGPSGAGKTTLALALVDAARGAGRHAALVADDRVALHAAGGRLVARPPARLAGLVELRGSGILAEPHEPAAVIRCVVDILDAISRLPEPDETVVNVCGIRLPRHGVARRDPFAPHRLMRLWAL